MKVSVFVSQGIDLEDVEATIELAGLDVQRENASSRLTLTGISESGLDQLRDVLSQYGNAIKIKPETGYTFER